MSDPSIYTGHNFNELIFHFYEPWMYIEGDWPKMFDSKQMKTYYNHPFPGAPSDFPEGTRVYMRRIPRFSVPHDSIPYQYQQEYIGQYSNRDDVFGTLTNNPKTGYPSIMPYYTKRKL